jgi:hypothetical protein
MAIIPAFIKDPSAILDYKFDYANTTNGGTKADYLASGETITTATVTAETGLTVTSYSATNSSTSVTAWLSGGTVNADYLVTCRIVTSANRTDERSIRIKVRDR